MAGTFAIQPSNRGLDGMLQRYAGERDDVRANQLLGELFEKHVREAVRRAVIRVASKSYGIPFDDAEDLKAEVTLNLLGRLRKGRTEGALDIASLGAYAEQIARNAAHNRNNRNRPLTAKLAANMRYAIKSTPSLAMWRAADGTLVVGLAEWLSPVPQATCRQAHSQLTEDSRLHAEASQRGRDGRATGPVPLASCRQADSQLTEDSRLHVEASQRGRDGRATGPVPLASCRQADSQLTEDSRLHAEASQRGRDGRATGPVPLASCRQADSQTAENSRLHAEASQRGQDARATLCEHPELVLETIGADRSQSLREQLTLLFNFLGQPIAFSSAVTLMAAALGCTNAQTTLDSEFGENGPLERAVDPSQDTFASTEQRAHLRALWDAIHGLSPLHRAALLLNLRDPLGRGVLGLLPELGIASRPEIALAVAMPVAELEARWDDLPMDDAAIGARYGVTACRIVGLRRTARERLARALQAADGT
ncbi:MAG: hypothetical protein K1X67_17625 [Fimbriimonadaceae bacterium]|nr:hypothetical protein [Fimbriimonadaceae bacterium]